MVKHHVKEGIMN